MFRYLLLQSAPILTSTYKQHQVHANNTLQNWCLSCCFHRLYKIPLTNDLKTMTISHFIACYGKFNKGQSKVLQSPTAPQALGQNSDLSGL